MRVKTEHVVFAGLGFVFLILLGIGVFADRSVATLVNDSKAVVETVEVKKSLEEVAALLGELRTPAAESVAIRIRQTEANIRKLTADNQRQQGRLDVLQPLVTAMLKAPSPALMNEIRRNIGLLQNEEDRLLGLLNAQNQQVGGADNDRHSRCSVPGIGRRFYICVDYSKRGATAAASSRGIGAIL